MYQIVYVNYISSSLLRSYPALLLLKDVIHHLLGRLFLCRFNKTWQDEIITTAAAIAAVSTSISGDIIAPFASMLETVWQMFGPILFDPT